MNEPAKNFIRLFRRVASKEWHIGKPGETMSHGNIECRTYVSFDEYQDVVNKGNKAIRLLNAAVNGPWSDYEATVAKAFLKGDTNE